MTYYIGFHFAIRIKTLPYMIGPGAGQGAVVGVGPGMFVGTGRLGGGFVCGGKNIGKFVRGV